MTVAEGLRTRLRVLSRAFRRVKLPDIRQRLAQEIAGLGTPAAYRFLIEQAGEDHPRADDAIDGLISVGGDALADLIRAILEKPDVQGFALALPPELPDDAARELLTVLPRVTNPAALRWLAQKIAAGHPNHLDGLVKVAAKKDNLQKIAMIVGIADAGHQGCAESVRRIVATADSSGLRLVLSCRVTWDMPEVEKRIAELLVSDHVGERRFAVTIILQAGWNSFAPEALRLAVYDADPVVRVDAQKVVWSYAEGDLPERTAIIDDVASELVDAARKARNRGTAVGPAGDCGAIAEALDAGCNHARRLLAAVAPNAELGRAAAIQLLRACEYAGTDLTRVLQDQAPPASLFPAYERLLTLQLDVAASLWRSGGVQVFVLLQKLMGTISVDHADAAEPMAGHTDSRCLVQRLRALAGETAQTVMAQIAAEDAHRPDLLRELSVARRRRLSVLTELPLSPGRMRRVAEALRGSRAREKEAIREAVGAYGKRAMHELQTEFNERALVAGTFAEAHARRFMIRATGVARGEEEWRALGSMAPVVAEQILQADLLASLAIGEATPPADVLIDGLGSSNADVRAAAEQMLWRHGRRLARELVEALEEADDAIETASILEVLRCIDHPQLDRAREAATAENELLRAVGVKCLSAWGEKRDAERALLALDDSSELVQTTAVETLGSLDPVAHVESLYEALGSPRFPVRDRAVQALAKLDAKRLEQLARRAQQDGNRWRRVGTSLESLASGGDPAMRRSRGIPFSPAGDSVLGARMAFVGDGPWQWGLTGLCAGHADNLGLYTDLVQSDDELCAAFDEWMMTGDFPHRLFPRLQRIAAEDRPHSSAAAVLAIDALQVTLREFVLRPALDYYRVQLDHEVVSALPSLAARLFRSCTPDVVDRLAIPNPSAASAWPDLMAYDDPTNEGMRFALALIELLKAHLYAKLGGRLDLSDTHGEEFLCAIERAWDRLLPYQDWFYGFWVVPDVALEDLGQYCADRGCNRKYRRMICSYLGYLATAAPCFEEKRTAARKALRRAFEGRLRHAAKRVERDSCDERSDPDSRSGEESSTERETAAVANIEAAFERALDEFDIYWASPQPMMPLGTLGMAWVTPRGVEEEHWTVLPERHVPFAHMVEQLVRDVMRDFREKYADTAESSLGDEEDARSLEELAAAEATGGAGYCRGFEDELLDALVSGESTDGIASSQLVSAPLNASSVRYYDVPVEGRKVKCVDIRGASVLLDRHEDTLRRRHAKGDIPFVWHEGRRYLPVESIPAARIALREVNEWTARLGVSRSTFYRWKTDLPDGLDLVEMERRLLRKAGKQHS